jgi:hypothetical protein
MCIDEAQKYQNFKGMDIVPVNLDNSRTSKLKQSGFVVQHEQIKLC